ncbi:MAG: hypothetical protein RLZZ330_787 [Actinomycetota bacterium]|jgi:8-oxo-dGTP diphosphatase
MIGKDMTESKMHVSAAVIFRGSGSAAQILSCRRTEPEHLKGGWEFAGGGVDEGETPLAAVHREIREELTVEIDVLHHLVGPNTDETWDLTDTKVLHAFISTIRPNNEIKLEPQHDAFEWLNLDTAESDVKWLEPDIPILRAAIEWIKKYA